MKIPAQLWRCRGCHDVFADGDIKPPEMPGGLPSCPTCGSTGWDAARVETFKTTVVDETEEAKPAEEEPLPLQQGARPHEFRPSVEEIGRACASLAERVGHDYGCVLYPEGSTQVAAVVAAFLSVPAYPEPENLAELPRLSLVGAGCRTLIVSALYDQKFSRASWGPGKIRSVLPRVKFAALYCKTSAVGAAPDFVYQTLDPVIKAVFPW